MILQTCSCLQGGLGWELCKYLYLVSIVLQWMVDWYKVTTTTNTINSQVFPSKINNFFQILSGHKRKTFLVPGRRPRVPIESVPSVPSRPVRPVMFFSRKRLLRIFLKFGMKFRHQNWRSVTRPDFWFLISKRLKSPFFAQKQVYLNFKKSASIDLAMALTHPPMKDVFL